MLLGYLLPPTTPDGLAELTALTAPGDVTPGLSFFQDLVGGDLEAYAVLPGLGDGTIVLYGRADRGDAMATCHLRLDLEAGAVLHLPPHHDATVWGPLVIVGVNAFGSHRSLSEEEYAAFQLVAPSRPSGLPELCFDRDVLLGDDPA